MENLFSVILWGFLLGLSSFKALVGYCLGMLFDHKNFSPVSGELESSLFWESFAYQFYWANRDHPRIPRLHGRATNSYLFPWVAWRLEDKGKLGKAQLLLETGQLVVVTLTTSQAQVIVQLRKQYIQEEFANDHHPSWPEWWWRIFLVGQQILEVETNGVAAKEQSLLTSKWVTGKNATE